MSRAIKRILAALALSVSLAAMAVAGPFEDGVAAFERGDYQTALRLLKPLADQGDADAQFAVGGMYHYGSVVPQDYAEAVKWYRLAAEQGHAGAQYYLGAMYGNGKGVLQDFVLAHMWLNLSAAASPALSAKLRDMAADARNRVAKLMTPDQIAEAQRLAREWKPK